MVRLKIWLAALAALVGGFFMAFFAGRKSGKAANEVKHVRRRVEVMDEARKLERQHENLGKGDVDQRLSDGGWVRPDSEL